MRDFRNHRRRGFLAVRCVLAAVLAVSISACATGMTDVAYANVSLQDKADRMDTSEFDKQNGLYKKAEAYYLRGRDKALKTLDKKYPGFKDGILSGDPARIDAAVANLTVKDVPTAYWGGSGWLGAFSLNPLDDTLLAEINGGPALLEAAIILDPDYNSGAIYDVLMAWYASAPPEFGGNEERAQQCFDEEIRLTRGLSPGPYVTWANSWCKSRQDADGFTEALTHALSLKPGTIKGLKTIDKLAQKRARWLLEHKDDFFLIWEDYHETDE